MSMEFRPATPLTEARNRVVKPIQAWFDNRVRWRHRRRVRAETARLEAMTVRMVDLRIPMTPPIKRLAVLLERLPSMVLSYGYGKAEALAIAATTDPDRIDPLVAALKSFTDNEILGHPDADRHRAQVAVTCRNDLMEAVRDIVSAQPKPGAAT
jgi:hypothetical protein